MLNGIESPSVHGQTLATLEKSAGFWRIPTMSPRRGTIHTPAKRRCPSDAVVLTEPGEERPEVGGLEVGIEEVEMLQDLLE
jgi:hypothetical protein